ncbi:hypothetical protein [Actinocorallia populi]|uniref:hypothetical protein n=1 Tax=Actinocorallia populi TaxID=2079200 RepID=UPI000D08EE40|nr:hypothetical protein [Actinocorallia populi]
MRTAYTALAFLPLALTAACGGAAKDAEAAPPPALSLDQAKNVFETYAAADQKADSALDQARLPAIATGSQLEMDTATYRTAKAGGKKAETPSFTEPVFYVPRIASGQRWFAVDAAARTRGMEIRHALLFVEEGGQWKLAADPQRSNASPIKGVQLDEEGYAEAAADGLQVAPADLPAAHAALLTQGPQAPGAEHLAAGQQTTQTYDALQKVSKSLRKSDMTFSSTFTPAEQPSYALRTQDGGAVAWYVLKQQESYKGKKIPVSGELTGLLEGGPVARKSLTSTSLLQYLAAVPREGQVAVVGLSRRTVAAQSG